MKRIYAADYPCQLVVKSVDEKGRFEGYASVFNITDRQKDEIKRGAFRRSIREKMKEIKLLWQHEASEPIGIFEDMREDSVGLFVKGKLLLDVRRAQEAYALLKEGAVKGLSIGYSPIKHTFDKARGVRIITDLDLWEISLVTFPANEKANVTSVKSEEREDVEMLAAKRSGAYFSAIEAIDRAIRAIT